MATALTAAVLILVIAEASRIAVGTPVWGSNRVTVPWWESRPRAGLPGMMQIALSANAGWSPPRQAGIRPMKPSASGGAITVRSGMCVRSAA